MSDVWLDTWIAPNPDGSLASLADREHLIGLYAWGLTSDAVSLIEGTRIAIETYLAANFSSIAVVYPNRPASVASQWLQTRIIWDDASRLTIGGTLNRLRGVRGRVELRFCARPGTGLGPLYDYADTVRDLFTRIDIGTDFPVWFGACAGVVMDTSDSGVTQLILTAPFEALETV